MHPVRDFKANFDPSAQEGIPTDNVAEASSAGVEIHEADSHVRNVCFVWADGRKAFFNYAYLVSVDLVLNDALNVMLLYFSGQIVTLKGYHLGWLFDLLLNHIPKTVTANNSRYYVDGQAQEVVVTDIMVKSE